MLRTLSFCALWSVVLLSSGGCGRGCGRGGKEGHAPSGEAAPASKGAKVVAAAPKNEATPDIDLAWDKKAEDKTADKANKEKSQEKKQPAPKSGLLTAGSFDDNLFPDLFHKFASRFGQGKQMGDWPGKVLGKNLIVTVKGKGEAPLGNARVEISDGETHANLITRSDGRAIFLSSWDGFAASKILTLTVTPPDGSAPITETIPAGTSHFLVSLPSVAAPLPKNLDLVLVLDTTGSMGDELEYLKSEIKSIVARVQQKYPQVNQRFALILYRDEGDEYVTRTFPFTNSVEKFQQQLAAQQAAGGGDYPEAVQKGLAEALKLQWRTADTARVVFLIGDAPPHPEHYNQTLATVAGLRKKGVVVYPLACSGYDEAVELIWRSSAMVSGGQFLFLTDDSGIGEAHAEPRIPFYHVEHLNNLMIRMIASELSGQRLVSPVEDILRTVGQPPAAAANAKK